MDEKNKDIIENSDIIGEDNITDEFLSGNIEQTKSTDNFANNQNLDEDKIMNNLDREDTINNFDNNQNIKEENIDENKGTNFPETDTKNVNQNFNENNKNGETTETINDIKDKINDFKKSAKPVYNEIFEKAKTWFSKNPFEVFLSKLSKQATFTILGINILVTAIASILILNSLISLVFLSLVFPYYGESKFTLFLTILIIMTAFYGLFALTIKLLSTYLKGSKTDYMSSLELVALITLPTFIISLAGLLLGFIYAPIYSIANLVIIVINIIGIYEGVSRYLGVSQKSIFWPYVICISLYAIVLLVIYNFIISLLIRNTIFYNFPF